MDFLFPRESYVVPVSCEQSLSLNPWWSQDLVRTHVGNRIKVKELGRSLPSPIDGKIRNIYTAGRVRYYEEELISYEEFREMKGTKPIAFDASSLDGLL